MTMMIQRVNANSPAQAVKSRARGPTITQLRAKQAALVAEDSIRGLIRRYEEGLICRYSGGAATACMVDARAEAEEVVQRISAILQGRSESEAAAPTLHPKTNKPVGE